jgi:hypothetical protein
MRKLIFPSVERDHARQHERKSDLAWPRPNQMLRRGSRSSRLPPSPPGPGGYHDRHRRRNVSLILKRASASLSSSEKTEDDYGVLDEAVLASSSHTERPALI